MKFLIMLSFLISNSFAQVKEFTLSEGKFILSNPSGNILIKGHKKNKIKIDYTKIKWEKNCHLSFSQDIQEVEVKINQDSNSYENDECQVDFTVSLPSNLSTSVKLGSGNIDLSLISGDVEFKIGSGDITLQGSSIKRVSGKVGSGAINILGSYLDVDLKIGSGDIKLQGSYLDTKLKTGTGKISAIYHNIKEKSRFIATSGNGNISIKVPSTSNVKAAFKSALGNLKNKASYNENADLEVNVTNAMGNLTIDTI